MSTWAKQTVGSNTILVTIPSVMDMYAGTVSSGLTFPEIYDRYAYRIYAWEHEGYEFREECRFIDAACLCDAFVLAEMYYDMNPDCSFNEDKTVARNANYAKDVMKVTNYGERDKYIFCGFAVYVPKYTIK